MLNIVSININKNGGVPKHPVAFAYLDNLNVRGDKQNDKKHHGGVNRAVCLFSYELIDQLKKEGHPIFSGSTEKTLPSGARLEFDEVWSGFSLWRSGNRGYRTNTSM